ncbi:MAG: alpha-1,2-fucosyltransferase [Minisyncoccota bacterium]
MIITEIYDGQGLGNQLWCYVTTRVIAEDHGYLFGIKSPEKFKCNDFMNLDFGEHVIGGDGPEGGPPSSLPMGITRYYLEKRTTHPTTGADIRIHDRNLLQIRDATKIDGVMQDEHYIAHRKDAIKKWLQVKKEYECREYSSDNICIINFRGGGYVKNKEVFLRKKYWEDAVENMKKIRSDFTFIVITDDVGTAKKFFPRYEVFHFTIAKDYSIIQNARYLILSNSSFAWFPAWLNENLRYCIAPKYWAAHNTSDGYWSCGYNITSGWLYQDRQGTLWDYVSCRKEFERYVEHHQKYFQDNVVRRSILTSTQDFRHRRKKAVLWAREKQKQVTGPVRYLLKKKFMYTLERYRSYRAQASWLSPDRIREYRKTIKIYDVFTFFNELELLEIRLNILDPHVDYFVIVEAPETFSGLPKPLYFAKNKQLFKKWEHKIIHYVIGTIPKDEDDLRGRLHHNPTLDPLEREIIINALTSDNVAKGAIHWLKEFYQKESLKKALVGLSDDDICYVSDVDEIWDPKIIIDYSKDDIFKLRQRVYAYYLNNRSNEPWAGVLVTKYKNIKDACLGHLRTARKTPYTYIEDGGWHFTNMGGADRIRRKIESYGHQEFNNAKVKENIEKKMTQNKDFIGRKFKFWLDEKDLPEYLLQNRDTYKNLFT